MSFNIDVKAALATDGGRGIGRACCREMARGGAGTNEDVSGAVAFLASPSADQITGDVIHVNGGTHSGQ